MPIGNAIRQYDGTHFRRQNSDTRNARTLGLHAPGVHAGRRCNVLGAECRLGQLLTRGRLLQTMTKPGLNPDVDFYPARFGLIGFGGLIDQKLLFKL